MNYIILGEVEKNLASVPQNGPWSIYKPPKDQV